MSGFDTTLDVLIESMNRDAPRLLGHVLTRGDMRLRRHAVARLIESKNGRAQSLLVRHFEHLGHGPQRLALESIVRLGPGLRAAMSTRETALQRTVVEMVRDTAEHSFAYLCGEAANASDERVQALAVDVLWRWSLELRRQEMALDGPAELAASEEFLRRRGFVLEGVQRAFTVRFGAESPRVLKSAAMLADHHAGWFWGAMGLRRDRRRLVLLASLRERVEPEMFSFLVRALEHDGVASEAAEVLQRPLARREVEMLLTEFQRSGDLGAGALRRLGTMPWLGAGSDALEQAAPNLVATALALGVGSGMPRARLAVVGRSVAVNHPDIEARRIALETLAHCGEVATAELSVVALTAPMPTAGAAVAHLARRGVLEAGDNAAAGRMMTNLLRDWSELAPTDRREVGRAMATHLRARPNLLRHHLISGSRTRRAAVGLARLAQVGDLYATELRLLATDDADTQVQSAALAAVAEGLGEGVAAVLDRGLASWDARVRANAVEALDRREADGEMFLRFIEDPAPRVRANAVRALLDRGRDEGRQTLQKMLTGGEADRLSGLWVFSRAEPEAFRRTAELLARNDPSERVRDKAAELLAG